MLVWDPQGSWPADPDNRVKAISSLVDLVAMAKHNAGPKRVAFVGHYSKATFQSWARCAYLWGVLAPCTAVAEELAMVTNPGKAPAGWHRLVSGGLKYGIDIIAITQRPSESDSTVMGNATRLRCFRMQRKRDREMMAGELDIPVEKITRLAPLHYVERMAGCAEIVEGRLTF